LEERGEEMKGIEVFTPENLEEAISIRASEQAVPLAGGTDLMVKYRRPSGMLPDFKSNVILLGKLSELRFVKEREEAGKAFIEIGALTTFSELLKSEIIPKYVKEVIGEIAAPGIRNMATIGGNICNASPAGDTLVPLYCLNAVLTLVGPDGKRKVKIEEFIKGPGKTELGQDELLISVSFEKIDFTSTFYRKVGTRRANALSKVSFMGLAIKNPAHSGRSGYSSHSVSADGVGKGKPGKKISDLRIAFGAVAPTVVRSRENEEALLEVLNEKGGKGKGNGGENGSHNAGRIIEKIKERSVYLYSDLITPIDDQRSRAAYRKEVSLSLLKEFIVELCK